MTQNKPYADLEIRILKQEKAGYPVEMTLNNERQFKRGYLAPRPEAESWDSILDPVATGQDLFDWFLTDGNLKEAWGQVREQRPHRIRLRIDHETPELHPIPWELLQEPGEGDLSHNLAQRVETPFSRYLAGTWQPGNPILKRPIKMLVAVANPENLEADYKLSPIDVEQEYALIEAVTQGLAVACDLLPQPCTLSALEDKLKEGYHILHFIGHGSYNKKRAEAVLYMADEAKQVALVKDRDVATMLASQLASSDTQSEDKLRLVFLSSCQTATRSPADAFRGFAPRLVDAGVPAVLAMQDLVAVDTARTFTSTFYQQLLDHGLVDRASNEARAKIQTEQKSGPAIPVLFMRLRSGQLLGQRGKITSQKGQNFWDPLLENIGVGKCVVFLGPRANVGLLPNSATVAQKLLENRSYPLSRETHDLAKVTRYISLYWDDSELRRDYVMALRDGLLTNLQVTDLIKEQYRQANLTKTIAGINWAQEILRQDETSLYHLLADLPIPLYLTTNVDNFMVEALKQKEGATPRRMGLRWKQTQQGSPEDVEAVTLKATEPIVLHLNGHDDEKAQFENLILTEDDYLAHLIRLHDQAHNILPANVITALADHSLLFLGYSLDDWEFRVIWQGLLQPIEAKAKINVGVQLEAGSEDRLDNMLDYLNRYMRRRIKEIDVYWGTPQQFVAELHHEWELVKDQIKIKEEADDDDWWK